ncbi:starch-binding domain-containing protein 1 [Lates japonicus]|uniref:Starch-binding domain-containing protein 1 n=1 Tax=Lates japonicus TaxID=270547 RepID=A0AAD3MJX7_LATJO|nr:starch-binding domain-containing protein 1 [Lates japonicus]
MTVVQDSYKVAERFAEEASHNLQCDTYKEMEMEDAGECHQGATDDTIKEVIEEVHDKDRCLKEPELIIDESHEEEEKVFKAEDQEDENVTIDKDVSDEKTRQEEENFLCASSNQLCFEDTPCMSEIVNDDRLQDNKTALEANSVESNLEEPVIHIEDVPVICIGYGKHEEFEEENHHPDSIDYSNYSSNHFSPEKEKMNEGEEAEEEYVDQQFIPQQNETWSLTSEQEPNLPSSQQDECHYMIDKVIPPIRDSDWDDDSGLAGEVTEQGMVFGPYPSHLSQQPHREYTNGTKCESFAANEDMFGHEIEDSYYREMEQFLAQIAASTINLADELKKQTDMKAVVEVVEIEEKREGVSIAKKVETEAEKEKEEDHEKTEISIMEATMDNNEWITDSNYQALPWMNLSATSSAQDHTKNDQPPTEDRQHSSSLTDASCIDTDTPPSTEVKQTSTLSLVDENTENSKKVVAVQPMPQNVNVTFRIHYLTHSPYQTVAVTGNQQELGNWKEFILLERAKDGHWATVVSLPAESHVEWKFVVVDKGEVCRWEECGNRLLDTGYGDDLIVHKWWGFL